MAGRWSAFSGISRRISASSSSPRTAERRPPSPACSAPPAGVRAGSPCSSIWAAPRRRSSRRAPPIGASGAAPTSTPSPSSAGQARRRASCRAPPGFRTTPSSMTGRSPSASCARRRSRRWRRCRGSSSGMSAPAAGPLPSNGCARRRHRHRARCGAPLSHRPQRRGARRSGAAHSRRRGARRARRAAAAAGGLPRRRHRHGRPSRQPLGHLAGRRPPRRQCGDARGRSGARRVLRAPGRRAHPHRRGARRAHRRAARLAPAAAGDAARGDEARRRGMMEAGVSARLAAASRGWRPWALLLTLSLALYLPGIGAMPPLDRDEARFMQASRQMLESGDLLRIRFQDEARNKKPAGIYWLQAASVALVSAPASTAAWPYRLPSLLGATAAVLFVFGFGARLVGRPAALIAAALLAASVLLVAEAHLAKTDAVLLAATAAAQGALGAVYAREREEKPAGPGAAFLFWIAEGLGILIKGPVLPLVSLLTVLGLGIADRRWRWLAGLRPAWGVPLALALVLPWFIAIEAATGGAFAGEAVGHDFLGKLVGAQESHGAPPLTYLLLLPVTFWPGSALLTVGATAAWRHRGETALRFLLAWLVPSWIVFELVPTKLPHYVLPLYPALALLIGSALLRRAAASPGRSQRLPDALAFALWALVGAALILALIGLPIALGGRVEAWSLVPAAAILGCAFLLLRRFGSGFGIAAAPLLAATGF